MSDDIAAADETAQVQGQHRVNVFRFVVEAQGQLRAQEKYILDQLAQIGGVIEYVSKLETELADAKTAIRAMAEADADSDCASVQLIAKTFLSRI